MRNFAKPKIYTAVGVILGAESIDNLRWSLDKMKECLDKPILSAVDWPNEWSPEIPDVTKKELKQELLNASIEIYLQGHGKTDVILERDFDELVDKLAIYNSLNRSHNSDNC